ncbi:MAG: PSD1 and planctomycete cytochrome C domain-containing protein [Verrucomicrobiota bacterium]
MSETWTIRWALICSVSLVLISPVPGAGVEDGEGLVFFEERIRPALVKYCYECHSEESGKSKGGLMVDTREGLLSGGDTAAAVVPGDLAGSLLVTAMRYEDEDYEMPPKEKVPDGVLADFEKWVAMGAPDARVSAAPVEVATEIDVEAGRAFWAYRVPEDVGLPPVGEASWARTGVDLFVARGLAGAGLAPAEDADALTLIRRLYFVITGLPPGSEEVREWERRIRGVAGSGLRQEGVRALVDYLLGAEAYGERWGRHWLDVARFAESTGGDSNSVYPHAWRYRNYVIDSFNADTPYDRFILEQLAGDLLPISDDGEWARNLVATGFLAAGVKLVGEEDDRKFFADVVDEQIDATTRAFLATTVSCARCHDHKTDPIPQSDYYALAGIFRNTETHYGLIKAQARQFSTLLDVSGMGLEEVRVVLGGEELARLEAERDAAAAKMDEIMATIRSGGHVNRSTLRRSRTARDRTEAALQAYDGNGAPRTFVMGVQERDALLETRLLVRGELDKPGQVVPAGFVQVMSPWQEHGLPEGVTGGGRLELAEWIASPEHPLTARVMVNRIWHYLFGQGLVRTVDDFGATGEAPSHPELLDYLARRFVESGWSVKSIVREIVLSRAWQQSSAHDVEKHAVDPDNRLLWRMSPRRLEAEAIRDAMLAASGRLERVRPAGSYLAGVGEGAVGKAVFEPEIRAIEEPVRSVYLPRVRNVLPEAMELFDAPDASLVIGARATTTVPLQALYMMNGEFVRLQAEALAAELVNLPSGERIEEASLRMYGRPATLGEREGAREFAHAMRLAGERRTEREVLAAYCQALFCAAEFSRLD